ncbi:hypothetical protein [Cellulomonas soli]|uniref:Uncharacterized protein n=1 Tax=Cellulomonas soli TaxID=931535 RepID=A0A512PE20_9CELL|nr:hypothetical protein [Cellulomonas soli]NYI59103.1 hypothetical protein [Cellulomonas soli]GEP69406.1 hypothetical protein CSO01_21210 [Cellulomonas soli]
MGEDSERSHGSAVEAVLVDPRDVNREGRPPRFRVALWTGTPYDVADGGTTWSSHEETYELRGVDVLGAVAWAEDRARVTPDLVLVEVLTVHDCDGGGLTSQRLWVGRRAAG